MPSLAENLPATSEVQAPSWFAPLRVLEFDISKPVPVLAPDHDHKGLHYTKALVLVRYGARPLAAIEVDIPDEGLPAGDLEAILRREVETDTFTGDGSAEEVARERFFARAPFASVIIATRNRPDRLARCLDSVAALEYPAFEVIVVDNNPSDEATAEFFMRHFKRQTRFRYVREDRPGLAAAHNRGVLEMARQSAFAAFTDDDVLVDRFWLSELMRGFEATPNVGCVTGLIFPAELETWPQLLIEQFGGFNKGFQRQVFDQRRYRPDDPLFPFIPGRFGSGANMAFRTTTLRRLGGFDPVLGTGTPALGGDDLAAFLRVIINGEALVYEPGAIVHHAHYREYAALQKQIYGYGVGLTAFLTKAILDQPMLAFSLLKKMPRGLGYALNPRSGKNRKKGTDYPAQLTSLERKGMVHGPLAALRSVQASRRYLRHAVPSIKSNATT